MQFRANINMSRFRCCMFHCLRRPETDELWDESTVDSLDQKRVTRTRRHRAGQAGEPHRKSALQPPPTPRHRKGRR